MPLTIRHATPADAEIIHGFVVALAEFEREPRAVEATPETFREQLASEDPPFECLIAEDAGRCVGFALFFRTYSTWRGRPGIHLEDVYVTESHRRRGVASALLESLAALTVERGFARLEWSVLDWNEGAIAFYRRIGGAHQGEWQLYRLDGAALDALAARRAAP